MAPGRRRLPRLFCLLLLPVLLVACGRPSGLKVESSPHPLPTPRARLSPVTELPSGLLTIVLDGVRTEDLKLWLEEEELPTLSALLRRGRFATLQPVEPALPESALATLLSGRAPAEHGWVALSPPALLSPFWKGAEGHQVGLVGPWPAPYRATADYGIAAGGRLADGKLHRPTLAPAQPWADAPASFSPRLEGLLSLEREGEQVGELFLLAVDTLNDGQAAYNEYWIAPERRIGRGAVRLAAGESTWGRLQLDDGSGMLLRLVDGHAATLQLYQSPRVETDIWPESLAAAVRHDLGFYPPDPDLHAYEMGWLSPDELGEMARVQTEWLAAATGWLWERSVAQGVPLVMARWPAPGRIQATLLAVDPAQTGWSRERQEHYAATRRETLAASDGALAALLARVDLSRHTLFVTSPLGVAPVWRELSLPLLLQQGGVEATLFQTEPLGGIAWLRPRPGMTRETLLSSALRLVEQGEPATGQPLFSRVVAGEEIVGKRGEGVIFVQAQPGYRISDRLEGEPVGPAQQLGQTAGAVTNPHLGGWWMAVGRGVRAGMEEEQFPLVQVAATAARLLGLPGNGEAEAEEWLSLP